MSNDSSTGGYITPEVVPVVSYDNSLEDIFQGAFSGITGVAGNLVRPRWQPEPPNQPDFTTDWIALAVSTTGQDVNAYQAHDPEGDGTNQVQRDEYLDVFISFYGPNCHQVMSRLREGLQIEQNRWVLLQNGIHFTEFGDPIFLPALLKEKNVKRVDAHLSFTRRVALNYAIRNVVDASGTIDAEIYSTTINVNQ